MVAVVVAHAAAAYTSIRLPGLLWSVRDRSSSQVFDWLFWGGVSVGMPLFFTISGFLAAKVHDEKGARGYAADRVRRILIPFLVGVFTVLPLCYAVWGLGWVVTNRSGFHSLFRFRFIDPEISAYFAGPAHLWFLEYLIVMLVAYGVFRRFRPEPADSTRRPWIFSARAPFFLALPTLVLLTLGRRRFGLDPVMDMRNWFVPDPFRLAHHAWFFLAGTWMYARRAEFERLKTTGPWFLGLAGFVFLLRLHFIEEALARSLPLADQAALALSGSLFAWFAVYGSLGVAQRLYRSPTPGVRWLAESSYWVYLIHFPIVGLIQVRLWTVPWSAPLKFTVALSLTMAIGLITEWTFVRNRWIGRWLFRSKVPSKPHFAAMQRATTTDSNRSRLTSEQSRESA